MEGNGDIKNLIDLYSKRQDDLRIAEADRINDLREAGLKKTDQFLEKESQRIDEIIKNNNEYQDKLLQLEINHIHERLRDHEKYTSELSKSQAERFDVVRSIDTAALTASSEKAAAQALALAKQLDTSNETLRNLVSNSSASLSKTLEQISTQLADRLLIVERAQYEMKGKAQFTDPNITRIESLEKAMMSKAGEGKGRQDMWGYVVGAIGFLMAIASFIWSKL
jgi:hypothetical protein